MEESLEMVKLNKFLSKECDISHLSQDFKDFIPQYKQHLKLDGIVRIKESQVPCLILVMEKFGKFLMKYVHN